jgi:hypothetical protein
MIRQRSDLDFLFITKRITRLADVFPDDWGSGYDNVAIGCTCDNQAVLIIREAIGEVMSAVMESL